MVVASLLFTLLNFVASGMVNVPGGWEANAFEEDYQQSVSYQTSLLN